MSERKVYAYPPFRISLCETKRLTNSQLDQVLPPGLRSVGDYANEEGPRCETETIDCPFDGAFLNALHELW
jgi:hypothetical protein